MAQYNESTASGTTWTRCDQIVIRNPFAGLEKSATFSEENVAVIGEKILMSRAGFLNKVFNPSEVIELRDPITGETTGETVTHQELYNILYSLYIQTATARDQAASG